MKKSNKVFWGAVAGLFVGTLAVFSCINVFGSTDKQKTTYAGMCFGMGEKLIGDGHMMEKTMSIANVNTINAGGIFDVTINQGNANSVLLSTDQNILPAIKMSIMNSALTVAADKKYSVCPSQTPKLVVNTATLNNINLGGKTTLHANGIKSDQLNLIMSGDSLGYVQGDIKNFQANLGGKSELHVDVANEDSIELNIGGNGAVYLSGKVKNLTITTGGKALVDAKNLVADNVSIMGAGKSDIIVNAVKTLSMTTAGKSDVKYYGNPDISKNSFGETTLEKMSN